MRIQLPELRLLKVWAEWFLMVVIFVASTVALYEHDDPAHNDVHTAGHEAIQSIRISVQRTGTAPTTSLTFHVRYIVLVMNVAFY